MLSGVAVSATHWAAFIRVFRKKPPWSTYAGRRGQYVTWLNATFRERLVSDPPRNGQLALTLTQPHRYGL
jgi:hypothetical protein